VSRKTIAPAKVISGAVELPGDKSISHRYALLAALARGRSEIENYSPAADCASTLACVGKLGAKVEKLKGNGQPRVAVTGAGLEGWKRPRRTLDAENSGTTLRLLTGLLAGQKFDSSITGDASLRRRPMRRVIEPLSQMGARIEARESNFAPLEIHGASLHPIRYALPVASAQVKSAILLAGLLAEGESAVEERVRTRDHTELALAEFGAAVRHEGSTVSVMGRPALEARHLSVPGDLSSAVFFLAAAMVLPGSKVLLHEVGLNPTRAAVLDVFSEWGARLKISSMRSQAGELVGDVIAEHAPLSGGVLSGPRIAQLIDELPMLAALGPYTEQGVDSRRQRTAHQGKRPHRRHGRKPAAHGRQGRRASRRTARRRPLGRPVARRRDRSSRRPPHRHGVCRGRARSPGSHAHPRRRMRGRLLPRFFRRARAPAHPLGCSVLPIGRVTSSGLSV
jgi:3-phosphoshikimate 1-carboxyvinyltransferase